MSIVHPGWLKKTALKAMVSAMIVTSIPGLAQAASVDTYRWRQDDGSEATASWTATAGSPIVNVLPGETHRLRFSVSHGYYGSFVARDTDNINSESYAVTYGSYGSYAYVGTSTGVHKIRLSDGVDMGSYTLPYGGDYLGGVIDPTGTYGYFMSTHNYVIHRVSLASMTLSANLTLPNGTPDYNYNLGLYMGANGGYLYAHVTDGASVNRIAQVELGDFFLTENDYNIPSGETVTAIKTDATGNVYMAVDNGTTGTIKKFSKTNLATPASSVSLGTTGYTESFPSSLALDATNGNFYVGTYTGSGGQHVQVIKGTLSPLAVTTRHEMTGIPITDGLGSVTLNADSSVIYAVNGNSPANIYAIRVSDGELLAVTSNGGFDYAVDGIVFDSGMIHFANYGNNSNFYSFELVPVGTVTMSPRLEYSVNNDTCATASGWTQVPGTATSEAFEMAPTANLADAGATTNAAGVSNLGTTFVAGQVKDTSSQAATVSLDYNEYTEAEFSVKATAAAGVGDYCFRLSDAGDASAVTTFGTQYAEMSTTTALSVASHHRWRLDDGSEANASWANGAQDTALTGLAKNTPIRLRYNLADDTTTDPYYSSTSFFDHSIDRFYRDPAGVYGYGLAYDTGTQYVYKYDLTSGSVVDSYSISSPTVELAHGSKELIIDAAGAYAYLPMAVSTSVTKIAKIDLATMSQVGGLQTLGSSSGHALIGAIKADSSYLYLASHDGDDTALTARLTRVSLASFPNGTVDFAVINTDELGFLATSVKLDETHGNIYVTADSDTSDQLVKVSMTAMTVSSSTNPVAAGFGLYGSVIDSSGTYLYGMSDNGHMLKIRVSDLATVANEVNSMSPAGWSAYGNTIALDEANGYVYVGIGNGIMYGLARYESATLANPTFINVGSAEPVTSVVKDLIYGDVLVVFEGVLGAVATETSKNIALQYAPKTGVCANQTSWTFVPDVANSGEPWQMAPSTHLTDGQATTEIAGITAPRASFVPGVAQDETNMQYQIVVSNRNYTSAEWSIEATANATDAGAYCFRVATSGEPSYYASFAEATLEAAGPASEGITDVSYSPLSPTTDDLVTLSATAASASGVSSIELFLDGTDTAHRVRQCTYGPTQSPATCSLPYGALESGSHTMYARYTDGTSAVSSMSAGTTINVGVPVAGAMTKTNLNRVTLGRLQVGLTTTARVEFNLNRTLSGTLTVTFPAGFGIVSGATSMSSCLSNAQVVGQTITATKSGCSGGVFMDGIVVALPSSVGIYRISWVNDDPGWTEVIIVSDDQINVAATVDPTLTFDVGAASACNGTFTSNDWSVDLGRLNTGRNVASSGDASGAQLICTKLSTNATSGAVVTVKNANGASGLVSISKPADTIPSVSGSVTSGTPRYGLCYSTVSGERGQDDGLTPAATAPSTLAGSFSPAGTCTASVTSGAEAIAALSQTAAEIWRVPGVTSNAFSALRIKAAISATQPAHNDYSDALTFVATAIY
jgi:hypothetical protein